MKEIKKLFAARTSIRRYERDPIPQESLDIIYEAVRNAPTSYNGQHFSVIDIDDQNIKEELYNITNQKQIKTCNRFFVFCVDFYKIAQLAKVKNLQVPPFKDTLDGIMVGMVDASLAMQSAVIAAEACGLGSCCIGYTRTAAPSRIAELLKLPKGVFVVCGLSLGVPREHPDVKPKLPHDLVFHKNHYRSDNIGNEMLDYDKVITNYNRNRSGGTSDNDWCGHMLDYYHIALRYNMKDYIVEQGFDIIK